MRAQVLLAILLFFSSVLADRNQAWNEVCRSSPPRETATIQNVEFRYICDQQCAGPVPVPGTYDHPNDCAAQITSSSDERVAWRRSNGGCWRCTGPGTSPNSNDVLVMEKVPEDPFGPEPVNQELYDQCKLDRDQCRQQLSLCKQERDNCQAGPGEPDPVPNTTPACKLHLICPRSEASY